MIVYNYGVGHNSEEKNAHLCYSSNFIYTHILHHLEIRRAEPTACDGLAPQPPSPLPPPPPPPAFYASAMYIYRQIWTVFVGEQLVLEHEEDNTNDWRAVIIVKNDAVA